MDRRKFLNGLGAGAVGLNIAAVASPAWTTSMSAADRTRDSGTRRSAKFCKIIGVGGAGCNFVLAASRSSAVLERAELVCVDLDRVNLNHVEAASVAMPGRPSIKTMSLAPLGSGGNVNYARAAALRKPEEVRAMLADADVVVLVAGLGGGTGSGVTPIMAHLAREAGVRIVAAVCVTPFEFEFEQRHRTSDTARRYLNRETDSVVAFSNETWANSHGDDTPMIDVFASLDRHIATCIRGLTDRTGQTNSGAEHGISVRRRSQRCQV